jgi:hypothetical protein
VLARVWNWGREPGASTGALNCGPQPGASIAALNCGPQSWSPIVVPNCRPQSEALTKGPKRRRKSIEIENIYPEKSLSEAFIHATALLDLLKAECTPGRYIKQKQLERWYAEVCVHEGWQPRHWTAIARQLGKLTNKRTKKKNGKKDVAYRVPKP